MYERRAMSQLIYMSKFLNVENEIGSVCDLGCGYGVFLQKCSTYAQNVSGYELDPLCIEYCRERGLNVNIIDNYYSSSSSSSGSVFNLTIMSHFLEHIPDIDDLLMHLRLHTRYLFIEIPATNINYPFANSGHVHFFNEKSISKLLQIRGFKIIDISRWGNSWKEYCRLIYIQKLIRHFKPLYRICRHIKEKYLSYIYENSQIHFEHNRTKQISRQYRENKDGIWIRVLAEVERAYTCNFSLKSSRSSH
jgi:SAM-dependent methyltransferase